MCSLCSTSSIMSGTITSFTSSLSTRSSPTFAFTSVTVKWFTSTLISGATYVLPARSFVTFGSTLTDASFAMPCIFR